MKRYLSILLLFAILISLCGCKQSAPTQSTDAPSTDTPTPPTEEKVEISQKPMYALSLIPVNESTPAKDGGTLFVYSHQNITLTLPEPEVADKIIMDFLGRMDRAESYKNTLITDSLEEIYATLNRTLSYQLNFVPARFDNNILSLSGTEAIYVGGIHADLIGQFATYDLLSGNLLSLPDILHEGITADTLYPLVIAALEKEKADNSLWDGYENVVKEQFENGLLNYDAWYLSNEGLCFRYDPYAIAPYVSGPISAEIPYTDLLNILRDEYFPAETDRTNGEVKAELFSVESQSEYTQFTEVILSKEGTNILLYADGAVTDVSIQSFSNSDDPIYGNNTPVVFAAYTLTPGDAIMVALDPTQTSLRISYKSGNETITKDLKIENGNIQFQ